MLLVSGCASSVVSLETASSSAVVSEAEVRAGAALQRFQAPGGDWGFMDASGRVVIAPVFEGVGPFSEGRAVFRDGDRYGYLDPEGAVAVDAYYTQAEPFSDGRARVAVGGRGGRRYGFVDPAGVEVVEPDLPMAIPYSNGKAVARLRAEPLVGFQRLLAALGIGPGDNHFVALDRDGQVVVDLPFVRVSAFSEGLAAFRPEGLSSSWGYVAEDGTVAIPPRFDGPAYAFTEGLARVADGGRLGFIRRDGSFVVEPAYEAALAFSEGLAAVQRDGRWGYIDRDGATVIEPRFAEAGAFSDGLAAVRLGGQWGYVDASGEVVIEPAYRAALRFRNGLALVYQGGRAVVINRSGEPVPPRGL